MYFRQVERKNRKMNWHEAVSSALNFLFLKEVSQNCFFLDVVNFKNWGCLRTCFGFDVVNLEKCGSVAELLRFWRCQVQKLRMSRRIASFLTLSTSNIDRSAGRLVDNQRKGEKVRERERERERKRGDLNHLSVHQWVRSAIRDSQQPTSHRFPPPPCAVLLVLQTIHIRSHKFIIFGS